MQRSGRYVSVGLLLLFGTVLLGQGGSAMPPEAERQLAREIYKEMVEIKSGYTTGATTPVAEAAARRLKAAGFPDADIFVGGAIPTKGNLVVRYRGTGRHRPLLLLAHIDVVEAKREDWSMDPFTLTERDGYFYGRGTGDDKAQAAVWIANLIRYKREGFKPDRDIIVALTADEEGGGPYNGVEWLLKNKRDLIDAEYCLNEGGWGESVAGKRIANDVQLSEKYVINYRLEVTQQRGPQLAAGPGQRDLSPGRRARPAVEIRVSAQDQRGDAGVLPSDGEDRGCVGSETTWRKPQTARRTPWIASRTQPPRGTRRSARPAWRPSSKAGMPKNALPQLAAANVNCRVLPDEKPEYVTATLKQVIADEQVSVTIVGDVSIGPPSPMRQDLMGAVSTLTNTLWPGVQTVPMMVMGATDGLYLRGAGIPTYGVQGFFYDRDDIRFHGRDERLKVQSFYEGQTFLYELVKRLTSGQ